MENEDLKMQNIELSQKVKENSLVIKELERKIIEHTDTIKKKTNTLTEKECSILMIEGEKAGLEETINDLNSELARVKEK